MVQSMRVGFALRSTVFHPSLVVKIAALLERAACDSVWFPHAGKSFDPRSSFDALDLCGITLGATRRIRVGTGIIRAGEQDPARLLTHVRTLSEASGGRFILGIGAGQAQGKEAIEGVVSLAEKLRVDYPGKRKPQVFFAALRGGMLRAALSSADGAILNFCPPSHVERLMPKAATRKDFTLACYVKLFFAETDAAAHRMLIEEFKNYDRIPAYHKMFEEAGISDAITNVEVDSASVPDELLDVSLPNPTKGEVAQFLRRFVRVGVTLPIAYPYVSGDDRYKLTVVKMLAAVKADN
jgi:hypothetical protein